MVLRCSVNLEDCDNDIMLVFEQSPYILRIHTEILMNEITYL